MARDYIVRESVPVVPGDGPQSSPYCGESPLRLAFFGHLTDYQLVGVSAFCRVHRHCEEIEFVPVWDYSLAEVLELVVFCPSCGDHRTYRMEGGE